MKKVAQPQRSRSTMIAAFALLIWMTQTPLIASETADLKQKKVLALFWYGKDYPSNIEFDRGLQTTFRTAGVEYYAEYFEPNRFPGESQATVLRDYLRQKYSDRKIDAVVAMSWVSADFLLKYRNDLFPDTPVVFHAASRAQLSQRTGGTSAGVIPENTYAQTLDAALRFHPDTRQVFVINGTIERDKAVEALFKEQLREFESRVTITYLTDFSLDELLARVKSLPERSLIYYGRQDYEDPGRRLLSQFDVLVLVAKAANVPIYSSGVYVGNGTVGGYAVNSYECGIQAGNMALQIVKGALPQSLPLVEVPGIPVFDWRELRRWGIPLDRLPPGSEIRFREPTLLEQYKWHIIAALALFGVQSFLIACLLAERRKYRRSQAALRESQERYRLATGSGQVVVWDWNLETSELYADPLLKHMLGYEEHEIGSHFEDWSRLVHPDDVDLQLEQVQAYCHSGSLHFEAEHRLVQKDGGVRWFLASGTAFRNNEGIAVRMVGTETDITERKLAEQESQHLSAQLLALQDRERQRIARELHDGTAQNVFAITINLECLKQSRKTLPAKFRNTLAECQTLCEQTLQNIRTLSYVLHPAILDNAGLLPALRWYVDGFTKDSGIDVQLIAAPDIGPLPPQVERSLFRIVQESLANVYHHSGSRTARVRMERQGSQLVLKIQDRGRGMHSKAQHTGPRDCRSFGVGLPEMRQRLRHVDGHLEITSDHQGTTITAVVPLAAESAHRR